MPTSIEILAQARATGDANLKPCPYLTPLFELGPPYKVAILHFLLQRRLLLHDPVGFGKTACALGAYSYYRSMVPRADAPRLLVLCPDSGLFQWQSEVHRLTTLTAQVLSYRGRTKLDPDDRRQRYLTDPADVWITTYGTAVRDLPTLIRRPLIVVFDEVQLLRGGGQARVVTDARGKARRDHRGKTLKRAAVLHPAAKALSQHAVAAWALTATPLMKRLEDIHGVYDVLVPNLLGSRFAFQKAYIRTLELTRKDTGHTFHKPIGYKNEIGLARRIAPYTLSRTEAQLGTYLPKILPLRRIDVELGPEQQRLYDACLDGFPDAAGLKRHDKLVACLKAQMLTDAPAVIGHPDVPSAKWDAVYRFVTEDIEDQPVVIYTFFATVARWLQTQFADRGITAGLITGTMNAPAKESTRLAFQEGQTRVVIVTSAGIYGVNLRAPVFCFYDLPWVWGDAVQAVGRARRRVIHGSPGTLLVAAVVATNTINERTLSVLRQSQEVNQRLHVPLQNLQNYAQNYEVPVGVLEEVNVVNVEKEIPRTRGNDLLFSEGSEAEEIESLFASLKGQRGPAMEAGPLPTFSADDIL